MSATLERTAGFEEHFAELAEELRSFGSDRLLALRGLGLTGWKESGWPTHKDEEWKYTSLRDAAETPWCVAPRANQPAPPCLGLDTPSGIRIHFQNGRLSTTGTDLSRLPAADSEDRAGVFVGSLQQALRDGVPEGLALRNPAGMLGTLAVLSGKLGSTNDERFKHLNTALFTDGALIHVPAGIELEESIYVTHSSYGTGEVRPAIHPRCLIVIEDGARAKVVETYSGEGVYFANAVTEVYVGDMASLEHVRVQMEAPEAYHVGLVAVSQDLMSNYTGYSIQYGGKVGRIDTNVWVGAEGVETRLDGIYVGSGDQVLDNKTRIDHAKPNCHSFEAYKGILAGKSVGVFNGKIFVYGDAQKTDAKQTNQALLLSKTATINTKPQLEIFADDVKCTHGATIGQLREDALFYLRARGIPEKEARALLVYAFAADVLERISIEPVRDALEQELYRKLHDETGLDIDEVM